MGPYAEKKKTSNLLHNVRPKDRLEIKQLYQSVKKKKKKRNIRLIQSTCHAREMKYPTIPSRALESNGPCRAESHLVIN